MSRTPQPSSNNNNDARGVRFTVSESSGTPTPQGTSARSGGIRKDTGQDDDNYNNTKSHTTRESKYNNHNDKKFKSAAPSGAVALALELEADGGANINKSSFLGFGGAESGGSTSKLMDASSLVNEQDEAFREAVKKAARNAGASSSKKKKTKTGDDDDNNDASGPLDLSGKGISLRGGHVIDDNNNDTTNNNDRDGASSHGRSSQGSSTHNDKAEQVQKLLSVIPGKDREDILLEDADADDQHDSDDDNNNNAAASSGKKKNNSTNEKRKQRLRDPQNLESIADDLEDFAAESEKMKRYYEEVLDQPFTGVVVIAAQSQTIVWVNQFASFMFNRVETDLIGQDVSMLMGQVPGRDNKTFHHRKIANFLSTWASKGVMPETKVASGRILELLACRFEGIKKVPFTAQIVVRPIKMSMADEKTPPAAFVGYFRDHTSEKSLKLALAMNRFTAEKSAEAIIVMDTYGTIREINKAACKLFGYSEQFLVKSEANIKLLMPENIAKEHDRYLKSFREKLKTAGFDIKTSPIIAKERMLTARRADGSEFPVELRVELHLDQTHSGNDRLIGYLRDRRALIKAQDFNLEVSKRLFPESIAKIVSQKSDIRHVETYKNIPVILIDLIDFIGTMRNLGDNDQTFEFLDTFFKQVAEIANGFQIEIVKTNADGMIGICGIDEFDDRKTRTDRIVSFGLEVLRWCQQNDRSVRIGIGHGELGSAVFEISKGRPTFDIWSSAINFASRCEKHAQPQTLQVTQQTFKHISDPELSKFFKKREYENGIKGMQEDGEKLTTYQTPQGMDHLITAEVTDEIRTKAQSRLYLKKENAKQLKDQQERRALTQG